MRRGRSAAGLEVEPAVCLTANALEPRRNGRYSRFVWYGRFVGVSVSFAARLFDAADGGWEFRARGRGQRAPPSELPQPL